jgi:processive 1,2-diacylglycerol beta-glucosyltransferase
MGEKILILSVSAGGGHVRAGQALKAAFDDRWGDRVESEARDVMDFAPPSFKKAYCDNFLKLVKSSPDAWHWMYNIFDRHPLTSKIQKLRRALEKVGTVPILKAIVARKPDKVVCTHFLPAELLTREKKTRGIPVSVVVTDFMVHTMWVHPGVDRYFLPAEELVPSLVARGVEPDRIRTTGIPVMPGFSRPPSRRAARADLGLDPDLPAIAILSGGMGVGDPDALASRILELPHRFGMIACAGRNADLLARLEKVARKVPPGSGRKLVPLGYTDRMEAVLAAADLAITKPGGLTTSECLAMGVPMLVTSPIPGQEDRNCDFLLENGAGWKAQDLENLCYKLGKLLAEPARLRRMASAAAKLGRPSAAYDIAEEVVER